LYSRRAGRLFRIKAAAGCGWRALLRATSTATYHRSGMLVAAEEPAGRSVTLADVDSGGAGKGCIYSHGDR